MKLAILGATGSVGRELVTQALAAGHEVTALVRAQPKPGEIDDRVALVIGDATSADAVKWTVEGRDAVLSALGHAKGAPDDLLAEVSSNLIAAMQADGVSRLVVLSSAAVVDAADRPSLLYRAARVLLRAVMPRVVRDHREQARLIEESGLAWTIVRGPIVFTDGPRTRSLARRPDRARQRATCLARRSRRLHARNRNRRRLHANEAAGQPVGASRCCRSPTDCTPTLPVRNVSSIAATRGWIYEIPQSDSDAAFATVSRLAGVGGITNEIKVITAGLGG